MDILATSVGAEETTCYQCKKVAEFGASEIRKSVTAFLQGKWADKTSHFVLCVASPLNRTQQQEEIYRQSNKLNEHNIEFTVWDGSPGGRLSVLLKSAPEIVDDFFGRPWVKHFNGDEAADSFGERLDGNELRSLRQRLHGLYATIFNQHDPGLRFSGLDTLSYVDRYVPIDITESTLLRDVQPTTISPNDMASQEMPESTSAPLMPEKHRLRTALKPHESRRAAFEWLSGRQHSIVLGDPGSGKSALLRYLALSLLNLQSTGTPILDSRHLRYLPVWISFARFAAMIKENPNTSVNDYFRDWLHQNSFDDIIPIFSRALRHSEVMLLVDGLDEGGSRLDRQEALDRIIAFAKSTDAAVICTSRPRGFSHTEAPGGWDTGVIAPMSDAQVQELARRWFSVREVSGAARSASDALLEQAQQRAGLFLHAVKENRRTNDLARNPLLCHAMIELYRFSHRLPEQRVGVYDKIIDLLLSQHPAARAHAAHSETPAIFLGIPETDLKEILIRIADDLQNKDTVDLRNAEHCRDICATFLEDDTHGLGLDRSKARMLARDTIEQLVAQYGLLVERSPGDIGFIHLSVQEYLAAEYVSRRSDESQLDWIESVWLRPRWRECVTNWFGIHGTRGNKGLTGLAVQRLRRLGEGGEWQRLQSLELLTELACTDLGLPINESRKTVEHATRSVDTSPFPTHRVSLARNLTLGAVGSGVRQECIASLRRWVHCRPSRANLIRSFKSWQAEDDLRETLLRSLHDEDFQCRLEAMHCLLTVFASWPQLENVLYQLSINHPRPEVRSIALRGMLKRSEWAERAAIAAEANLQSSSAELLLVACTARVQLGCHDEDDLKRLSRILSARAVDYLHIQEFTETLCAGWPADEGIRKAFTSELERDDSPMEFQIPLQYLLRCYPNDDEIALLVAGLFDRREGHLALDMAQIWKDLIDNFRGHLTIAKAVRRFLNDYKEKYEAIFWHPRTTPGFIVIGDDAARDELLHAYPSEERGRGRYWIAKTLIEGWPEDESVLSSLRHWATRDTDTAAPLAKWAVILYPKSSDRRQWLEQLVKNTSREFVSDAIYSLLSEFPDENTRKLVEPRAHDTKIWYYNRIGIQGWMARAFPSCPSSLETVKLALENIDGPQLSDFSASYENHPTLRSEMLDAAVAAPEDVRLTIATTFRDRAIDAATFQAIMPKILAEESAPVRSTAMIARARASKGNAAAENLFSGELINELSSRGMFLRLRRLSALGALIELGHSKQAVSVLAKEKGVNWDLMLDSLNKDTASLGIIVDNWHAFKQLLDEAEIESTLPIRSMVEYGYGPIFDQAKQPRDALDDYLRTCPPDQSSAHYLDEVARRFPRSAFLRDRLLTTFDNRIQDYGSLYHAARLLLEHFQSDTEMLAKVTEKLMPSRSMYRVAPSVFAILNLSWPGSKFGEILSSTPKEQQESWSDRDRLLVAVSLGRPDEAESAAVAMLGEPLFDWKYRREDIDALRIWSQDAMALPVLHKWLESEDDTLSMTAQSLVGGNLLNRLSFVDRAIERFNKEMTTGATVPTDGLDAISGTVTSWVIHATAMIQNSTRG